MTGGLAPAGANGFGTAVNGNSLGKPGDPGADGSGNSVTWIGALRLKALPPGRYRLRALAARGARQSKPVTHTFTITC